MNVIKDTVLRHISENNVVFVFSTEIVASLWAKKSLLFGNVNSISLKRFIAWDTFKRSVLISKDSGGQKTEKKSVSAVIRTLFVQSLLSNCGTHSPFPALVPDSFACDAELFVSWFTRILPELQSLQKRYRKHEQHIVPCAELQDLLLLEDTYRRFLNEHDLFEPSWECVDMIESGTQYYIFFPHLFDDFGEYEAMLASCQSVHVLYAREVLEKVVPPILRKYVVAREELRATAHEIRRLYDEEGVPFEEIAITVPNLERAEPYIRRELSLYAIPVQYRSGKALASYSAGKLFHLIQDCVTQHFSFQSLKALLLNPQLPWKNSERAEQLIEFGIENNCVCAYMQDGVSHDVWEETFQRKTGEYSEELLRRFYAALKKTMTALCASHSFSELRRHYFAFRYESLFFDETAFTDEANDVLGRCLDELAELISIEEKYPDLIPKQVFSFYVSLLRERMYVKQSDTIGVSIFPYRVAAGAPFQHHFIIDASQDALTVLYRPFDFLRSDIRESLSASDTNVSELFLAVYALATGWDSDEGQGRERLHVSCATKNLLGYTTPHGYFLRHTIASAVLDDDAFDDERRFFASGGTMPDTALAQFFDTQKKSFASWQASASSRIIFLTDAIAETNALRDIMLKKQYCADEVRVSATDLNLFFECRRKWLYRKILRIREISLEAQLVDDTFFGLIYHAILKDFFEYVKEIDHVFVNTHAALYRDTIYELSSKIIRRSNTFSDPVAQLLLHGQIETIAEDVAALLAVERTYFDGYAVQDLEKKIVIHENGMYIEGVLDRVSVTQDDEAVLLDYKMNNMPKKAECIQHGDESGQTRLGHFQIALYAYLYEKVTGEKIRQAAFISILKKDIQPIIGVMKPKRAACTPEIFEQTISVLSEYMMVFKKHIQDLDFSVPEDMAFEHCVVCDYKTICRTVFTVDGISAKHKMKKSDEECV